MLGDRNKRYWAEHEEMNVEHGLRMEVAQLHNMLQICVAVIVVIVAIAFVTWLT